MKAYKGFDKDMKCRGFQFEEGKSYEEEKANLCHSGFHACEHPLNVFEYYSPNNSQYHEVELGQVSDKRDGDTKVCAKKIEIGAKLTIGKLVDAAIRYTFERSHPEAGGQATGDQGAASATGDQGAASATGYQGAASATGEEGVASSIGWGGKARGEKGCFLVLAEWEKAKDGTWHRTRVKSCRVDGNRIKAMIWYRLEAGKFVEVTDDD